MQTDGFAAPYLFVTSESRSYSSLVELRVDGYEQWQGNATGFEATVPVALTVRLRNLPPSTSTADPATGNVTGDATLVGMVLEAVVLLLTPRPLPADRRR